MEENCTQTHLEYSQTIDNCYMLRYVKIQAQRDALLVVALQILK